MSSKQSEVERRQVEATKYMARADRAKRDMMSAIETYVQVQVCVALAYERLERAREKESES